MKLTSSIIPSFVSMVDRWVAVKKVVKSLYLKGIDHFYSLLIEVSFESICDDSTIVAQKNATIPL